MTYEILIKNVCDANESHIEDPFDSEMVEIKSIVFGNMFNPKTMRWEEVYAKTYTFHDTLRNAKKLLKKS